MSKRQKSKRSRKKQPTLLQDQQPPELRLVLISSPLSSWTSDERDAFARQIGGAASHQFEGAFADLQERLLQFEPLSLLATLSLYQLTAPPGRRTPRIGREPLHQHHVELLQALILRHRRDNFPWMPTFPDLAAFADLADLTSRMFFVRRIAPADSPPDGERRQIQESIRLQTQAVRNWGYPHQMWRIVADLFAPLNDRIETETGVRVADLQVMCRGIANQ